MHQRVSKRILVILGSFGVANLERAMTDWRGAFVVEMDYLLPESWQRQGARAALKMPVMDHQLALRMDDTTRSLLNEFLEERVTVPGVETRRDFRANCLSKDAPRIIAPFLLNLEMARRVQELHGPGWDLVMISPGAGVSMLAWRQFARECGASLQVLPEDEGLPPLRWRIMRRLAKWWHGRQHAARPAPLPRLPVMHSDARWLCGDKRLERLLARDSEPWHRVPDFNEPDSGSIMELRGRYLEWWGAWWQDWVGRNPKRAAMDPGWILDIVGRHFCEEVYPSHFLLLEQAREKLRTVKPAGLMVSSMRGKRELMWLLAAREHGIPVGACTLDDAVEPSVSFQSDVTFCDDMRHQSYAVSRGVPPEAVVMFQSHRALQPCDKSKPQNTGKGRRATIILADTFFSGGRIAAMPFISLWAIRLVVETARLLPEHDFLLKMHPLRERPRELFSWSGLHLRHLWCRESFFHSLSPPSNVRLTAPETLLTSLLKNSGVLLNIQSYAAFEAYALKIPVIQIAAPESTPDIYKKLLTLGVAQVADTPGSLAAMIRKNLHDTEHIERQTGAQQEFLRAFYAQDVPALPEAARQAFMRIRR